MSSYEQLPAKQQAQERQRWAEEISRKPGELRRFIHARLVALLLEDNAVAIRAAEMLLTFDQEDSASDLSDIPTEVLRAQREKLRDLLAFHAEEFAATNGHAE